MALEWRKFLVLQIPLFVTFLISGLVINAVQAILFFTVGTVSRRAFRKINYYLVWALYAQLLFIGDWWSGSRLFIFASPEALDSFGSEHAIVVMGHHYEIDWMLGWMVAARFGVLGNARVYVKKMLRYVPVVGWAWAMSDVVFLERDWNKDKEHIARGAAVLSDYPDSVWMLIFAEGTRLSPSKLEASQAFAKERGLPVLKHHLTPRTKGFVHTVQNVHRDSVRYIYDATLVIDETAGSAPTLSSLLTGNPIVGNVYVRRIPLADVPLDESGAEQFLMDLYQEKDALKGNFLETGSFTRGGQDKRFVDFSPVEKATPVASLVWSALVNILVMVPLARLCWTMLCGSKLQATVVVSLFLLAYVGMRKMVGLTQISKSSDYGKKEQ